MADHIASRRLIQVEDTQYKAAVSENVGNKLGESLNFHAKRQYDVKEFFLNGPYSIVSSPQLGVDGLYVFPFDCAIINVSIFNLVAGTAGPTELDVKHATTSGGAFSSIFSVTPKIASTAGNNTFALSYDIDDTTDEQTWTLRAAPTGVTLGQLSATPYNVSRGDAIRIDKITALTDAENCGLLIYHRPR